jgi:hypothetical protein
MISAAPDPRSPEITMKYKGMGNTYDRVQFHAFPIAASFPFLSGKFRFAASKEARLGCGSELIMV